MELSDSELIQACLERNPKAWGLFAERFSKLIYWSIRKIFSARAPMNPEEEVQEVFQEVFERLIEKEELKKLQQAASLRKFLSVTACHAALDKLKALSRAEKRFVSGEALESQSTGKDPAFYAAAGEQAGIVGRILSELSSRERACVEFHYLNDLTFRETGALLGISEEAARTIVRRAKEKIKAEFGGLAGRF